MIKPLEQVTGDRNIDGIFALLKQLTVDNNLVLLADWNKLVEHIKEHYLNDDRIMKEYNCGKQAGCQDERTRCARVIMDIAAEHFVKNEDDKARHYRELAKKIKENK